MKNRMTTLIIASTLFLLLFGGCRQRSIADEVERLPDLPQDIAATLDPVTMATKIPDSFLAPVKDTVTKLAPCCDSTNTKSLKVRMPYARCGPLRDFIVAPIGDFAFFVSGQDAGQPEGQPRFTAFKLRELNGKRLLDQHVCIVSQGPWDATLTEARACSPYTPQQTLVISAFGNLITYVWNGGVEGHPLNVKVVSCRNLGTTRGFCPGALSECQCPSTPCSASQPCECGLLW